MTFSVFLISLHSAVSLSSLVPPCKDILLFLCHYLSLTELKTGNHKLAEDCLGKDLCFHLSVNYWKRGRRPYSFSCFLYSYWEFSAQKSSGLIATLLPTPVQQKNEVRPAEWTGSLLQLLYPRSINLIARQKISTKEHVPWHNPVTSIWGTPRSFRGTKTTSRVTSQQITTERKQYHLQCASECNSIPGERGKAML